MTDCTYASNRKTLAYGVKLTQLCLRYLLGLLGMRTRYESFLEQQIVRQFPLAKIGQYNSLTHSFNVQRDLPAVCSVYFTLLKYKCSIFEGVGVERGQTVEYTEYTENKGKNKMKCKCKIKGFRYKIHPFKSCYTLNLGEKKAEF